MEKGRFGELGLIITNSHLSLGLRVANILGVEPLKIESRPFPNEELEVRRLSDASGLDVCIFSSLYAGAGYDTLRELRLICSSLRGSATRIFGVFPFVRDGKSDHLKRHGETVAYSETAFQISSCGLDVVAIFDQHSPQHPNFFDTKHYRLRTVHHIYLMRILIEYAMSHSNDYDSVLALDEGSFKRNRAIAQMLGKNISFINKHRDPNTRVINLELSNIIGNVNSQKVAAFDDMLQEGGTLETGARIARLAGAKEIHFFFVHNDFSPNTINRINLLLEDGTINKIYTLETIPLRDREKWHPNLEVISPARLIAEVIRRIHLEGHMRDLFLEI